MGGAGCPSHGREVRFASLGRSASCSKMDFVCRGSRPSRTGRETLARRGGSWVSWVQPNFKSENIDSTDHLPSRRIRNHSRAGQAPSACLGTPGVEFILCLGELRLLRAESGVDSRVDLCHHRCNWYLLTWIRRTTPPSDGMMPRPHQPMSVRSTSSSLYVESARGNLIS